MPIIFQQKKKKKKRGGETGKTFEITKFTADAENDDRHFSDQIF